VETTLRYPPHFTTKEQINSIDTMNVAELLKRADIIGGNSVINGLPDPNVAIPPMIRGPNGEIPNYIDPPSYAPMILGVSISFLILSLLFVIGRLYSRIFLLRNVAFDDYFVAFSWVQAAFFVFVCCYCKEAGNEIVMRADDV
jgi:hypothetical protein